MNSNIDTIKAGFDLRGKAEKGDLKVVVFYLTEISYRQVPCRFGQTRKNQYRWHRYSVTLPLWICPTPFHQINLDRNVLKVLRQNVLLRFCQMKFLILITTQNHVDALLSVWWTFDNLERQQRRNVVFIFFFFLREKKCICKAFQLDAAVPEKHLYFFKA